MNKSAATPDGVSRRNTGRVTGTATLGVALLLAAGGCRSAANKPAPIVDMNNGADPADANLAPVTALPADASAPYPATQTAGSYPAQRSPAPRAMSSWATRS